MNKLVNKFCNLLMKSGKKARAYALFSESFTLFLREREKILGNTSASKLSPWEENVLPNGISQSYSIHLSKNQFYNSKQFLFRHKVKGGLHRFSILGKNNFLDKKPLTTSVGSMASENMENILNVVVENVRPLIEIRKVRVARATYQVPAQISRLKGETLAVRWIIEFANKNKQKDKISLAQALAFELASAYRKQGGPRQRRGELHKLAEANRSYIRYRWW